MPHIRQHLTSCNQDVAVSAFELVQCTQALGLAHLPMDGQCVKAQIAQHQRQFARVVARPGEDHDCGPGQFCQKECQVAVLHSHYELQTPPEYTPTQTFDMPQKRLSSSDKSNRLGAYSRHSYTPKSWHI